MKLLRIHPIILLPIIFALLVIPLSVYDYLATKKNLGNLGPSTPPVINLTSMPTKATSNQPTQLSWSVTNSTNILNTTTLYWGSDSSPSALPTDASPQAVGYPNSLPDYQDGHFQLPSNFQATIGPLAPGRYYYRAYARIDNQHLWTPEVSLIVE